MSSIRGGLVSADGKNSTTTVLAADATFNSSVANYENVAGFSSITVNVTSDVDSAANGVIIYQSSDGANEDFSSTFTYTGGGADVYSIPVYAQYAKVEYVNGGSSQTQFRLQTIYHDNRQALRYGSQPKAQSLSIALASDQTFATSSLSYFEKIQDDSDFSIQQYSYDTTGSGYTSMFSGTVPSNERWYIWNMVAGCNNSNIGLLILRIKKNGTVIMRNSDYNSTVRHLNFETIPMIYDPYDTYDFDLWTSDSKVKCFWANIVKETI